MKANRILSVVAALSITGTAASAEVGTVVSQDGKFIASPGSASDKDGMPVGVVEIWDSSTGKQLQRIGSEIDVQLGAAISPDGKSVAVCGQVSKQNEKAASLKQNVEKEKNPFLKGFMEGAIDSLTTTTLPALTLYETETGKMLKRIDTGAITVNTVAFSPDGKSLAGGCDDNQIRIWEVASGKLLKTLSGFTNEVMSLSYSADGRRLAARESGYDGAKIKVWDMTTGQPVRTIAVEVSLSKFRFTQNMQISPNGRFVAAGDGDTQAELWDMATGKKIRPLPNTTAFAFSADSSSIALSDPKGRINIQDVATGRLTKTLAGHSQPPSTSINWLRFSGDGKLISSTNDHVTKVWDVESGKELGVLYGSAVIHDVAFDASGQTLALGNERGEVRLLDPSQGTQKSVIHTPESVRAIVFSPDGKQIAVGGEYVIRLYDVAGRNMLRSFPYAKDIMVNSLRFSHDGSKLAAAYQDSVVKVWNAQSGALLYTLGAPVEKREISTEDILSGKAFETKKTGGVNDPRHSGYVVSLNFSPDDKLIATSSSDNTVRLWSVESGKFLRTLSGHSTQVNRANFTPDGKQVVSVDAEGGIRIWDSESGKSLQTFQSPDKEICDLVLTHDGSRMITSTFFLPIDKKQNFIRVWDIKSGNNTQSIATGFDAPENLSLSPDEASLSSSSLCGQVRVWEVSTGKLRLLEP